MNARKAVVIGATGSLANTCELLAREGWDVTSLCRAPEYAPGAWADLGIRVLQADRGDVSQLDKLTDGVDLVVDAQTYKPDQAPDLARWSRGAGSTVQISSNAVYADLTGVVTEEREMTPWRGQELINQEGYSANKAQCERILLSAGERVSLLRPGKIHGPWCRRPREWSVVKRILDGRRAILLPGDGLMRESTTSTANLATAILACANNPGSRMVNVSDGDPVSVRNIVIAIADLMGAHVDLVESPLTSSWRLPWFSNKWLDVSKQTVLAGEPATFAQTVGRDIDWLQHVAVSGKNGWELPHWCDREFFEQSFDYAAEDSYLASV